VLATLLATIFHRHGVSPFAPRASARHKYRAHHRFVANHLANWRGAGGRSRAVGYCYRWPPPGGYPPEWFRSPPAFGSHRRPG